MKIKQYIEEIYTDSFRSNGIKATCVEIQEFYEAFHTGQWNEAMYELSQVILYILILLFYNHLLWNITLPDWLPWEEDYRRLTKWQEILHLVQAPILCIDNEWFNTGNNWKRPKKVVYVLNQAGLSISLEEAQQLINKLECNSDNVRTSK